MDEPRYPKVVDLVMSRLPKEHVRLCPVDGPCACMGCASHVVSREEFNLWKDRHSFCEHCGHFSD